jgi:CxxC motif-containing protein (DUF1111 family)
MRSSFRNLLAPVAVCIGVACSSGGYDKVAREPGEPLPGLSESELARFNEGKALFDRSYYPEEGLGPLYAQTRCSSCHDLPVLGGRGEEGQSRGTRFVPPDNCDLLEHEGGDNIQTATTPILRALGITSERLPPSATAYASMAPPALFGIGLIEAIPEEVILAREDPDDTDGDGISGRAGRTRDGRLGRFRSKGDRAALTDMSAGGFTFELGLTTPAFPDELTVNGVPVPPETDPTPEPEMDQHSVDLVTDYIRFLAPPVSKAPESRTARDTLEAGAELFQRIGCAKCHTPSMQTGPSEVAALDRKTVNLWSDLLLHDLGEEMAGLCGPNATPTEYRTAMLMGLRFKAEYMADGRAWNLRQAIMLHGGEGATSRDAFDDLSSAWEGFLIRFLSSL